MQSNLILQKSKATLSSGKEIIPFVSTPFSSLMCTASETLRKERVVDCFGWLLGSYLFFLGACGYVIA
jgi:hypothetical protein